MTDFTNFIKSLLKSLSVPEAAFTLLTTPDAILVYRAAFTQYQDNAASITAPENELATLYPDTGIYEAYEQIGDSVIKNFMTNYFYKRFPKLWRNNHGVKIVARLMIKYGSKEVLSSLAKNLGFEEHIIPLPDISSVQRRNSILEDVFEAFIGATSVIMDCSVRSTGAGFVVCYILMENIYREVDIVLDYEHLFDAKTRLKELIDLFKDRLGSVAYKSERDAAGIKVIIEQKIADKTIVIGEGSDVIKIKAEQTAATQALEYLKAAGFEKKVPREYLDLI
jgi:dsRNA-specific ribonuclease